MATVSISNRKYWLNGLPTAGVPGVNVDNKKYWSNANPAAFIGPQSAAVTLHMQIPMSLSLEAQGSFLAMHVDLNLSLRQALVRAMQMDVVMSERVSAVAPATLLMHIDIKELILVKPAAASENCLTGNGSLPSGSVGSATCRNYIF